MVSLLKGGDGVLEVLKKEHPRMSISLLLKIYSFVLIVDCGWCLNRSISCDYCKCFVMTKSYYLNIPASESVLFPGFDTSSMVAFSGLKNTSLEVNLSRWKI